MTWPDGYAAAPRLIASENRYAVRPIHWDDRERIRQWRNDQLDVLRQDSPLSPEQQDAYFDDVVRQCMNSVQPAQILVAFTEDSDIVGYGGVVHLNWPDRRGELSFLTATDRLDRERLQSDFSIFLGLLMPLCREELGLHKITTETYEFRLDVIAALEAAGFIREGTLAQHHWHEGRWVASVVHGLVLGAEVSFRA